MRTRTKNTRNKKLLSCFFGALAILSLGLFFVMPGVVPVANAQSPGEYTLLAPLPLSGNTTSDETVQLGGEEAFARYLNSAFKIGITIAILLAVIMIVIGGIQWMGESVFGKEAGKKKITDALWGLVLALAIFLILNTINPDLVNLRLKVENLTEPPALPPATTAVSTIPESVMARPSFASADELATREKLVSAGIQINKDPCPSGTSSWKDVPGGCTNVAGLPDFAIEKLKALKNNCNCDVIITAGTEPGHAEHGIGKNVVDISLGTGVTNYIKKTGKTTNYPGCSVGDKYNIDFTGGAVTGQISTFTDEKIPGNPPHWHVCL